MSVETDRDLREQASHWLEKAETHLSVLQRILQDYEHLRRRAEAAERENSPLRSRVEAAEHACAQLREQVNQLQGEVDRYHREREEMAEWLSRAMNDTLLRLRAQQAPPGDASGQTRGPFSR